MTTEPLQTVWSQQETDILKLLRPVCTTLEIKSIFDNLGFERSLGSIRRKSDRGRLAFIELGFPELDTVSDEVSQAIRMAIGDREETFISSLIKPKRYSKIDLQEAEQWFDVLLEMRQKTPLFPLKPSTQSNNSALAILFSDWHAGRVLYNEAGETIYNMQIMSKRAELFAEKIACFSSGYNFDEILVLIDGDMADGKDIFPAQGESTPVTPLYQVHHVVKTIWTFILSLNSFFPRVRIRVVTCPGNHGRIENSKISNFDNFIYQELELLVWMSSLDKKTRLDVSISNNFGFEYNNVVSKGFKIHMRHFAPKETDTSAGRSRFLGWYQKHDYDLICSGHWHHFGHSPVNGKPAVRNGSLMGGDNYAEEFGADDPPSQSIIVLSPNGPIPILAAPVPLS